MKQTKTKYINPALEKFNKSYEKEILSKRGIQGIDKFYVKTGILLRLEDISNRRKDRLVFGSSGSLVTFRSADGTFLKQNPTTGDIFLVLGYELSGGYGNIINIKALWQDKQIQILVDISHNPIRQFFSLVQHSVDDQT